MAAQIRDKESTGWMRYAPAGVSVMAGLLVLVQVAWVTYPAGGPDYERGGWALAATACALPPHLHHVYSATCGSRPRHGGWTFTALVIVVFGVLPLAGAFWLPVSFAVAVSALIVIPRPWSVFVAAVTVAAPLPLGLAMGATPYWASWFVTAIVFRGVAVFALVWLTGVTRRLQAARTALARQAVAVERARIDRQVQEQLGAALESIAAKGGRVAATRDRAELDARLRALIRVSREAAAEVRNLIRGYHGASAQTALETAVALLTAAGTTVTVQADDGLPSSLDPEALTALRQGTARLLADGNAEHCAIAVTVMGDGKTRVQVHPDGFPAVRTEAVS